jgi:hypothetical protein
VPGGVSWPLCPTGKPFLARREKKVESPWVNQIVSHPALTADMFLFYTKEYKTRVELLLVDSFLSSAET